MTWVRTQSKHFLKDQDIKRWYDNAARGGIITAEDELGRLGRFCQAAGLYAKSMDATHAHVFQHESQSFVCVQSELLLRASHFGL
jgi:hypothetical protein